MVGFADVPEMSSPEMRLRDTSRAAPLRPAVTEPPLSSEPFTLSIAFRPYFSMTKVPTTSAANAPLNWMAMVVVGSPASAHALQPSAVSK
jgi:hypothetical protein